MKCNEICLGEIDMTFGLRNVMKGLTVGAIAMMISGSAFAGESLKDAPYAPSFSWTGFYVGGHAGLAVGDTEGEITGAGPIIAALTHTEYSLDGGIFGGHLGYNHQTGKFVVGIEATYSGSGVKGNTACVVLLNCQRELDWTASVVGRMGVAMGRNLLYGLMGVVWADLQTDVSIAGFNLFSGSETHVGWKAGFGFEHALTNNIIMRIEYAHLDFGSETHTLNFTPAPGLFTVPDKVEAKFDTITMGVSYKF